MGLFVFPFFSSHSLFFLFLPRRAHFFTQLLRFFCSTQITHSRTHTIEIIIRKMVFSIELKKRHTLAKRVLSLFFTYINAHSRATLTQVIAVAGCRSRSFHKQMKPPNKIYGFE